MSLFCKQNLSPLQRRSLQKLGGAMGLTAGLTMAQRPFEHAHAASVAVPILAALAVAPVIFAIWVIARYLAAEQDEFVRALAVRALLWGVAVTMVGDAIAGVFMEYYHGSLPLAVVNADLLFASTGIAFRLLQRSYR